MEVSPWQNTLSCHIIAGFCILALTSQLISNSFLNVDTALALVDIIVTLLIWISIMKLLVTNTTPKPSFELYNDILECWRDENDDAFQSSCKSNLRLELILLCAFGNVWAWQTHGILIGIMDLHNQSKYNVWASECYRWQPIMIDLILLFT